MEDLRLRLKQIETTNEEDKQIINDAIEFINKIVAYGEKQNEAFASLGYVPAKKSNIGN